MPKRRRCLLFNNVLNQNDPCPVGPVRKRTSVFHRPMVATIGRLSDSSIGLCDQVTVHFPEHGDQVTVNQVTK
jgi:hypothetical protein